MGSDFLGQRFGDEKVIRDGNGKHVNIGNVFIFLIRIEIFDYFCAGNRDQ